MSAASAIYRGRVTHVRTRPRRHRLDYDVFSLLLDLDELPSLGRESRLFGHNRAALLSFHDRDHGPGDGSPLRPWVEAQLRNAGVAERPAAIRMLCYPRIFGYVFNPLTVYYCYADGGRLTGILYEVGNTFAERHVYVMPVVSDGRQVVRQSCRKAFYVSPFVPIECAYQFRMLPPGPRVAVAIRETDADGLLLAASFNGIRRPFSAVELLNAWIAHPLMTFKVIGAIHWEAFKLWRKGAPVFRHTAAAERIAVSAPTSVETGGIADVTTRQETAGVMPTVRVRPLWQRVLLSWAARTAAGQLTLRFPDGAGQVFRGEADGPVAEMAVSSPRPLLRLLLGGDLGLAEGYIAGEWEAADLTAFLEFGLRNEDAFSNVTQGSLPARLLNRVRHRLNANTRRGSRRNISFHYDLGNDFYAAWLDGTMSYSAGIFERQNQSFEEAQREKYLRLARVLDLRPGQRVLEIGCGWGGFAEIAAAEFGCQVVGLTLSSEQAVYARQRMARSDLSDKVDIRLQDYRDVVGEFDAIASIEMFEAVGEENWRVYFDALTRLLKPAGRAALQIITIEDNRFESYRDGSDFIQRYIFPGGMLPSPAALATAVAQSGLRLDDSFFFGLSYAETLRRWRHTFEDRWMDIEPLGFDEKFRRLWRYYLCYCEAGFRAGAIDVGQFLITKE